MVSLIDGYRPGFLETVYGPMRSGKTQMFRYMINRLKYDFGIESRLFKPVIDGRNDGIETKAGEKMEAISLPVDNPGQIYDYIDGARLVGVDEAQFFHENKLIETVFSLLEDGRSVIVSGLDTDAWRNPFGAMPYLISVSNNSNKMVTQCRNHGCDYIAMFTHKLGGDPQATVEVGDDTYEPRCFRCHVIPK